MNAGRTEKSKGFILTHAAYAYAKVETWLEAYANEIVAPLPEFTERVVELFNSQAIRHRMGHTHSMLPMSVASSERGPSKRQKELDEDPRSLHVQGVGEPYRRHMSKTGRAKIARAQRARWRKQRANDRAEAAATIAAETKKNKKKPFSYKGKHWTQTTAGKKRLKRMHKNGKNGRLGPALLRKAA